VTFSPIDEVDVSPERATVYEHGWQSWSPTSTYPVTQTSPRPELRWQHPMRFRPETPAPPRGFQAEGLLAVDPGTGDATRVYAAPDARQEVPSIRAQLRGNRLIVTSNGPATRQLVAGGIEAGLAVRGGQRRAGTGQPAARCAHGLVLVVPLLRRRDRRRHR